MKKEKIQAPKGVSEYVPPASREFEWVRDGLITPARLAGYSLMELPVFEDTQLFTRGVGESTDVVSKEMYTFEDRGGRSLTLRPEGTAGVMRSVIENNLDKLVLYMNYLRTEEGLKKGSKPNSLIKQGGEKIKKFIETLKNNDNIQSAVTASPLIILLIVSLYFIKTKYYA